MRIGTDSNFDFYPRSPCGERPYRVQETLAPKLFLSTLSLRRATLLRAIPFRIHQFLSTLSLRRATCRAKTSESQHTHFYPRSPCGERRAWSASIFGGISISIHALLAESDDDALYCFDSFHYISIHALLAESDPGPKSMTPDRYYFYPRSPCGERHVTRPSG